MDELHPLYFHFKSFTKFEETSKCRISLPSIAEADLMDDESTEPDDEDRSLPSTCSSILQPMEHLKSKIWKSNEGSSNNSGTIGFSISCQDLGK